MFAYCTNLKSVGYLTLPNLTSSKGMFAACSNLSGDIVLNSSNITDATSCFGSTTLTKNVYIPFNSTTYNSFINAGYDTNGTSCGVYLRDINTYVRPDEPTVDLRAYNYTVVDGNALLNQYIGVNNSVVVPTI